MTLNEAATALDRKPSTLRRQIAVGSLKATKVGNQWHVTPREVERYRAENLGLHAPKRYRRKGAKRAAEIRRLSEAGATGAQIARDLKVDPSTVSRVVKGDRWAPAAP